MRWSQNTAQWLANGQFHRTLGETRDAEGLDLMVVLAELDF